MNKILKFISFALIYTAGIGIFFLLESFASEASFHGNQPSLVMVADTQVFLKFATGDNIFNKYQSAKIDYLKVQNIPSDYEVTQSSAKEVIKTPVIKKSPPKKIASIGLPSPILSDVRIINGKSVCEHENDKPKKSKKTSKRHIDGECCLDPDEIPNSLCFYPQEKYGKLIQKYLSGK